MPFNLRLVLLNHLSELNLVSPFSPQKCKLSFTLCQNFVINRPMKMALKRWDINLRWLFFFGDTTFCPNCSGSFLCCIRQTFLLLLKIFFMLSFVLNAKSGCDLICVRSGYIFWANQEVLIQTITSLDFGISIPFAWWILTTLVLNEIKVVWMVP